jgi:hypothetical protein
LRPWLAMRHCGIPFVEINIKLRQPASNANILRYSPSGEVPTLLAGGQAIWDSLAILEYLAEAHPEARLWPQLGEARALARSAAGDACGLCALREHCPMILSPGCRWRPCLTSSPPTCAASWRCGGLPAQARRLGTIVRRLFGGRCRTGRSPRVCAPISRTSRLMATTGGEAYVDALFALPRPWPSGRTGRTGRRAAKQGSCRYPRPHLACA